MHGWRAWARPHGNSAVRPCANLFPVLYPRGIPPRSTDAHCKVESREKRGEGSAWMARVGAPARQFCRASLWENPLLTLPARQLCRAIRDGRPLHSGHALLSNFFSLFPTLDAHCIVATHYILPSSPCSLLSPKKPHCGLSSAMGLLVKKGSRRAAFTRS